MRFRSLADEFEHIVEAFGAGTADAMRREVKKLRARIVEAEAQFIESGKAVDEASYTLGAADVAAELLSATAHRAASATVLEDLRRRDTDLCALHQVALWTESALGSDTPDRARLRSQRALAEALDLGPSVLSRSVLPRLHGAGLVRQSNRSSARHAEITEAGLTALDQLRPGWRTRDARTNAPVNDMQDALRSAGEVLFEEGHALSVRGKVAGLLHTPNVAWPSLEGADRVFHDMADVYHVMIDDTPFVADPRAPTNFPNNPLSEHLRAVFGADEAAYATGFDPGTMDHELLPTITVHAAAQIRSAAQFREEIKAAFEWMRDADHAKRIAKKTVNQKPDVYRFPAFRLWDSGSRKDESDDTETGHACSA